VGAFLQRSRFRSKGGGTGFFISIFWAICASLYKLDPAGPTHGTAPWRGFHEARYPFHHYQKYVGC